MHRNPTNHRFTIPRAHDRQSDGCSTNLQRTVLTSKTPLRFAIPETREWKNPSDLRNDRSIALPAVEKIVRHDVRSLLSFSRSFFISLHPSLPLSLSLSLHSVGFSPFPRSHSAQPFSSIPVDRSRWQTSSVLGAPSWLNRLRG